MKSPFRWDFMTTTRENDGSCVSKTANGVSLLMLMYAIPTRLSQLKVLEVNRVNFMECPLSETANPQPMPSSSSRRG